MILLLLFALLAGAGTAITPCILPVLPALLSASAGGGRRRPLGIVLGLGVTFTVAIVALAQLVKGVGLASGGARTLAIVVLIAFGLILLIPGLAQRVQAPLSRLARFGPKTRGDGFWSGLLVGGALGFVCAPCAGPILAAVTSVSASTGPTVRVVLIALAYSVGLAGFMSIYGFGGRAALGAIKRVARGRSVEYALGAVLLMTGVAMAFNLDVKFEERLARSTSLPAFLLDPTHSLETSSSTQKRLEALRPASRFATREAADDAKPTGAKAAATTSSAGEPGVAIAGVKTPALHDLGNAPNFTKTEDWFNTPGGKPLSIKELRGHVVLVDFWTYTCINCIRTIPFVEGLYRHYHRYGLDVVGVETPEFTFEQNAANVRAAIKSDGITYPVVQDNEYGTWDAYQNEYWPAEYYIDADGEVRHTKFGEGNYKQDEAAVRQLLYDAGARDLPAPMTASAQLPSADLGTPETYLNPEREEGFEQPLQAGVQTYSAPDSLELNEWALGGRWRVSSQAITPDPANAGQLETITGSVQARDVYLVMTSDGNVARRGRVLLNGTPIPAVDRGADVGAGGYFTVRAQRLYKLVKLGADADFTITVELPAGVDAYDFTFG